jgi:tetratricopeptide (TPR) repeat protein
MIHHFWRMGGYDDALACGQRALSLIAISGDVFQEARANGLLATVYFSLGDYRRATAVLKQAIAASVC